MDNIVSIKRKAQKLVQQGSYMQAIEQYTLIVESGELDPYDYVVLGDLLLRAERRDDAVDRYKEALASYQRGGLNRNAIALAKRIRRLAPEENDVLRRLGDLYGAEGLNSEAALHYLEFLEKAAEEPDFAEKAEDVCQRLLQFPLPSFELVPRIVSICQEQGRASSLAAGVVYQAQRARDAGQTRVEGSLTALAASLDPRSMETAEESPAPADPGFMNPGAVTFEDSPAPDSGPLSLDDPGDYGAVNLDAVSAPEEAAVYDLDSGSLSLDVGATKPAPASAPEAETELHADAETPAKAAPQVEGDPDEIRAKGDRALARGDSVLAQREYVRASKAYFRDGRSQQAEEVYLQVVKLDPNNLEALRGLVDIAHTNGETDKMARYGCELGDVLLAREKYPEAKMQFERVLAFDPENQKAQSRVKRLAGMMGGGPSYQGLQPMAKEIEGSKVTIRDDDPGAPTQTALDLAAILDEFRAAVVGSIPETDSQSHYDMGMAYMEMGLLNESIQEFETAAGNPALRVRSLEVLGEAYRQAERFDDARRVFEELLAEATTDEAQARIQLALGKSYQDQGQWEQAEECYFQALEWNEELVEAAELLNAMQQRRASGA